MYQASRSARERKPTAKALALRDSVAETVAAREVVTVKAPAKGLPKAVEDSLKVPKGIHKETKATKATKATTKTSAASLKKVMKQIESFCNGAFSDILAEEPSFNHLPSTTLPTFTSALVISNALSEVVPKPVALDPLLGCGEKICSCWESTLVGIGDVCNVCKLTKYSTFAKMDMHDNHDVVAPPPTPPVPPKVSDTRTPAKRAKSAKPPTPPKVRHTTNPAKHAKSAKPPKAPEEVVIDGDKEDCLEAMLISDLIGSEEMSAFLEQLFLM